MRGSTVVATSYRVIGWWAGLLTGMYVAYSMQLAVDVCIPEQFGGAEGEAVYIGTYQA